MKYRVTLEVEANQMQFAGQFTHDCGICRWDAGDWLIDGPEYGPRAISDEEFRQRFTPVEELKLRRRTPAEIRQALEAKIASNPDIRRLIETIGGVDAYLEAFVPAIDAAVFQVNGPPPPLPHGVQLANDAGG